MNGQEKLHDGAYQKSGGNCTNANSSSQQISGDDEEQVTADTDRAELKTVQLICQGLQPTA